jgi:hypothetical protein
MYNINLIFNGAIFYILQEITTSDVSGPVVLRMLNKKMLNGGGDCISEAASKSLLKPAITDPQKDFLKYTVRSVASGLTVSMLMDSNHTFFRGGLS